MQGHAGADIPLVGCLANDTENLFTGGIEKSSEEIREAAGVTGKAGLPARVPPPPAEAPRWTTRSKRAAGNRRHASLPVLTKPLQGRFRAGGN